MDQNLLALAPMAKIAAAAFGGGIVGAISGLGGGVVIVPVLTLFFGIPIQQAVAISIISVIAVSSGAGSVYVRDHMVNIRIAMFLEVFTAAGALLGAAVISTWVNPRMLSILFGLILLLSLAPILFSLGHELPEGVRSDRLATWLRLSSSYDDKKLGRTVNYNVTGIPAAIVLMFLAGIISGLLGIGAGVVKVLAHEIAMKVPTKVSTATSNFMIGVTAAAGAGVYLRRGLVLPFVAAPVAVAVLAGAFVGTLVMQRLSNARVRQVFAVALGAVGVEMLLRGLGVHF